jgi:putative glutamine amidotransferase
LQGDEQTLRLTYEQLDGVFLTGGVDVDPDCYGEPRHQACGNTDPARDWVEIRLVQWAMADGKPILGVCRGLQIINVACGGSLYQHVPEEYRSELKHDCFPTVPQYSRDYLAHAVRADAPSRLGRLLGEEIAVNSMHHQGIKRLGAGLHASAHATDGLIEGIEGAGGRYLVGVQWHPEELADAHAPQRRLFTDFLSAAGAFNGA